MKLLTSLVALSAVVGIVSAQGTITGLKLIDADAEYHADGTKILPLMVLQPIPATNVLYLQDLPADLDVEATYSGGPPRSVSFFWDDNIRWWDFFASDSTPPFSLGGSNGDRKFFGSKYLTAYYEGVHTLTVRPYTRWGFAGEDFQVVLDIRAGSSSKQQAQELTAAEAEAAADKAAAAAAATARELQETEAPTGGVKPLEGTGAPSAADQCGGAPRPYPVYTLQPSVGPTTEAPTITIDDYHTVAPSTCNGECGTPTLSPTTIERAPSVEEATDECVYEAAELISMDGNQNYSDLPLTIVSATTQTVTFAVNQVWLDGSICAVATQYPVSTTDTECQREINVRPGEFAIHTAVCDESGQAEIDLYVHDVNFASTDTAVWPEQCTPVQDSGEENMHQVSYHFTLKCVTGDELCIPPLDKLNCTDNAEFVIADNDFETSEQADSWIRNWDGDKTESNSDLTTFLGRMGQGRTEVARTFEVPTTAESLLIEFDFLEIDEWEPQDKVFMRINEFYLNFGYFSQTQEESAISGYFFNSGPADKKIAVSVSRIGEDDNYNKGWNPNYNEQAHRISFNIPKSYFPDGRLTTGFRVDMNQPIDNESAGFDNYKVTIICGDGTTITESPTYGGAAASVPETGVPTKNPTGSPTPAPTSSPTAEPTASPTSVPTGGPTSSPTTSPTASPVVSPSMEPSAIVASDTVCIYEEAILVSSEGTQDYKSLPLEIISTQAESVTFAVSQVWVDGTICAVATEYPISDSDSTCQREINQRPGEIGTYTAFCGSDGLATVSVYVHDATFSSSDNAYWPNHCLPVENPPAHMISYEFTLNCVAPEDNCLPPADQLVCDETDTDMVILDNDFEDPSLNEADDWVRNWDGPGTETSTGLSTFLGRLGRGKEEITRTLVVPASSEAVLFEFQFYEIDQWETADKMYFRMNGYYLRFGAYSYNRNEPNIAGYFFSSSPEDQRVAVSVFRDTDRGPDLGFSGYSDQKHSIKLVIPSYYYPQARLTVGWRVQMSYPISNESAGIDNIRATVICGDRDVPA